MKVDDSYQEPLSPSLSHTSGGNVEPRPHSNDTMTAFDRQGPRGHFKDEREEKSDLAASRRDFLSQMPIPHRGQCLGSNLIALSPSLKRSRDDDLFSPSLYPRLTALKLESPCNNPARTPGQLSGFGACNATPLLNRSPSGPAAARDQESLTLPPLDLSRSSLVNAQVCVALCNTWGTVTAMCLCLPWLK